MSASAGPSADQLIALLPRLRRFARALTRNASDADDLVHVGIQRALTHFNPWRPGKRLEHWMFGIVRNAWIDEARARRRGDVHASDAPIQRLSLAAAMERLPEEQRLVVALVLVEGLAYEQAADVLEVSTATVMSRLVGAREGLEALLDGREAG